MKDNNSPTLQLSTENLVAGYDKTVIKEINLTIEVGKMNILVGSNGCGKSTLLKCLARVLPPFSGQVLLNGDNIHRLPSKKVAQQMALLPQGPIAPEGLSVKELVAQGRYPHQSFLKQWSKADEAAVNDAMKMANIEALADHNLSDLSGGQRQRCWIAMVLAQQTDIILLDEPTTFLDLKVQVDLLDLLSEMAHKNKRTMVIVLHELNLAAAYADNLIMMKAGQIYQQGKPLDIFTRENLQAVFDLSANVIKDADTGALVCIPTIKRHSAQ